MRVYSWSRQNQTLETYFYHFDADNQDGGHGGGGHEDDQDPELVDLLHLHDHYWYLRR